MGTFGVTGHAMRSVRWRAPCLPTNAGLLRAFGATAVCRGLCRRAVCDARPLACVLNPTPQTVRVRVFLRVVSRGRPHAFDGDDPGHRTRETRRRKPVRSRRHKRVTDQDQRPGADHVAKRRQIENVLGHGINRAGEPTGCRRDREGRARKRDSRRRAPQPPNPNCGRDPVPPCISTSGGLSSQP